MHILSFFSKNDYCTQKFEENNYFFNIFTKYALQEIEIIK